MSDFSSDTIDEIWEKAKEVDGYNPKLWRKDFAGAWIKRSNYGIREEFGWEIDHKYPKSLGGAETSKNLWPLHWRNNMYKGDDYPDFKTIITSELNHNIEKEQSWTWNKNQ